MSDSASIKRKTILGVSVVALCAAAYFAFFELRYRAVARRYPIGITLAEAQQKLHRPYPVTETGIVFPPPRPDEHDKEQSTFYVIRVPDERVFLHFNYHQRLIKVWKWTDPISVWLKS